MTEPAWYDPDYDDPADPFPFDVESARRWSMLPVVAMRPPFEAWWCPACQRLQQTGHYLHNDALTEQERSAGSVCPVGGVLAVRVTARPPVPAGPGLPVDGWWCPTCRYLLPDPVSAHPSRAARPARLDGCTNLGYRSVWVAE